MATVTVGGAFLSASLQVLFDKLTSLTLHEFGSWWDVDHELNRLRKTLLKILSVVGDTEMREIRDQSMVVWIKELKDVAYDADDVLDELEAEVLRKRVDSMNQVSNFSLNPNQVMFRREISKKINVIRERLDDSAKDRDDLRQGDVKLETHDRRETSSLVSKSCVFGREEDTENIIQMLIAEDFDHSIEMNVPPVLLIAGMCGIGKTTLAKLVYNDSRVDSNFQMKMWVHVSEEFSVKRISREIIESCCGGRRHELGGNWNMVQKKLKEEVQGKRFLLVLDDVWNVDQYDWEQLCLPLMYGDRGSKIVITTQNKNVAKDTSTATALTYCLEFLSDENCWKIFKNYAFPNRVGNGLIRLEEIGKELILGKLKGLPLAAKTLGVLCSNQDEDYWRTISESKIWELVPNGNTNLLSALRLSYQHLPAHLKQCFAYCSLFPKDYKFEKTNLIQMWMAQGFLNSQGRRRMEDVGRECFEELLSREFFQQFEESYFMHDMIHDLARFVSLDECYIVRDTTEMHKISERTRHVSLVSDKLHPSDLKEMSRHKSLRSLLFLRECKPELGFIPGDLFAKLRYIRVLDLSRNNIRVLPNSIGNLKHLRYLDLSHNSIARLPEEIGTLHNLQTLKLEACLLHQLPDGMTNLIKLRQLKVEEELVSSITRIGRLTNLQELMKFKVLKEDGHKIDELKDMAELQRIHISKLENVISREETINAALINKKYLRMLTLEWSLDRAINSAAVLDGEVLEGLKPHPNLRELNIWNNCGPIVVDWLKNQFLSNLEIMSLSNCRNWDVLPSLGQLRFLRYLEVSGMQRIKCVNHHFYGSEVNRFPSLVELRFVDMPEWEEWLSPEEGQLFPCLQELLIVSCPKLLDLPSLPPRLTRLWIRKVGLQALPDLSGSPSQLATLEISECPNLTFLQEGLLRHSLTALESLTITNCSELEHSTTDGGFPALAAVRSLEIENCPKLTALLEDSLPPLLADLKIGGFPALKEIRCLQNLTLLYSMSISDCPNIWSLPEEALCNLKALEELTVSGCNDLVSLKFQALVSLKRLTIENCPILKSSSELPSSSLEYLEISNTPEVTGLLQNLTSLLSLRIHNCPQLTSFVREEEELQKLASLQCLHILDCVNLQSLPATLCFLTALERLYIQNCPQIKTLPQSGLPCSLTILDIRQCPRLEVRCKKDEGPDWLKVSHIPCLYITGSESDMEKEERLPASMSSVAAITDIGAYGGLLY